MDAWYGIGEDYKLTMAYDPHSITQALTDWQMLLNDNRFKQWNFNVIRLAFKFANLPASSNPSMADHSDLVYTEFTQVARLIISQGYRIVLDDHSWSRFGSQAWMNEWVSFVTWLRNNAQDILPYIVGYELRNEASDWTYEQGPWWDGRSCPDRTTPNWHEHVTGAYAKLTDLIRSIVPNALVCWSDPSAYYYIPNVGPEVPSQHRRDGIVYSWHCWSTDSENKGYTEPNSMRNWASAGYVGPAYPNSRSWVGEFGSWSNQKSGCTYDGQKATMTYLMQWCLNNDVGFSLFYWQHWLKQDEYSDWLQTIGFVIEPPPTPSPSNPLGLLAVVALFFLMVRGVK